MIVDAHLDIAWNALARGHGYHGPAAPGYLVSRSELVEAGMGLVFATIFCLPAGRGRTLRSRFAYRTPEEAYLMARAQLGFYQSVGLPLIRTRGELERYLRGWKTGQLAAVLLMEGADPIEVPAQLGEWFESGVRILGLAWGRTRYSGGTGAPGGVTQEGLSLLRGMRRRGVVLDLSHMADRAVADALETWRGAVMASHSNARALCPGDRQLSDKTIAEIGRRGGVVGISFYRRHLRADQGPATLDDVVYHMRHIARVAGGPEHVGLGTDADGGFAAIDAPIRRLAEMRDLRTRLRRVFSSAQVEGITGSNWIDFLRRSLPEAS